MRAAKRRVEARSQAKIYIYDKSSEAAQYLNIVKIILCIFRGSIFSRPYKIPESNNFREYYSKIKLFSIDIRYNGA